MISSALRHPVLVQEKRGKGKRKGTENIAQAGRFRETRLINLSPPWFAFVTERVGVGVQKQGNTRDR